MGHKKLQGRDKRRFGNQQFTFANNGLTNQIYRRDWCFLIAINYLYKYSHHIQFQNSFYDLPPRLLIS